MPLAAMMAECLCARMCHDLSNPLSALSGVVDLMQRAPNRVEAGKIATQAIQIMQERLRFFRAAWCTSEQDVAANEIARLCQSLTAGRRFHLDAIGLTGRFSPQSTRIILNLVLLATDCAIAETKIMIKGQSKKGVHIRLTNAMPEHLHDLQQHLDRNPTEPNDLIHNASLPELIAILLKRSGHQVAFSADGATHEIVLSSPPSALAVDQDTARAPERQPDNLHAAD